MKNIYQYIWVLSVVFCCIACGKVDVRISKELEENPSIFPDYKEVTVPYNIAPLNFSYMGEEECCLFVAGVDGEMQVPGVKGLFSFSGSSWKELMERNKGGALKLTVAIRSGDEWVGYKSFHIYVAAEPIDAYLSYRLIPPGYEGWKEMGIFQRNLENYEQTAIYENKLTDGNCVNCHSYCNRNPDKMLFHARAGCGGTVMICDQVIEKLNTKTDSTISALVYPYWHPSGRYVAFSVNKTKQSFFNNHPNRVEVYDLASDVVVYNVQTHRIAYSPLTKSAGVFETFPAFSPDGRSLYFCSAQAVDSMPQKYKEVKYSLCRMDFDPENMIFGNRVDTLYNAPLHGKSVSFPRISPDGRFLAFTLHEFGNFSIWHKDADLYMADLQTKEVYPLSEANSDDVDSYHSWSDNSRWMVFSSRRIDGLYTRLFIAYIDEKGQAHKPFLLPQNNPSVYYKRLMFSYNIPELMVKKAAVSKHKIANVLRNSAGIDVTADPIMPNF